MKNNLIFSQDENKYKAICFFDIVFYLSSTNIEENFGVHVPILQEDDGLFYALCIELNQVTYGSNCNDAVERMGYLLQDLANMSLKGEADWNLLWEKPMDKIYFNIFHDLKTKYSQDRAKSMTDYIHQNKDQVETVSFVTKDYNIKSRIAEVKISQRYLELAA